MKYQHILMCLFGGCIALSVVAMSYYFFETVVEFTMKQYNTNPINTNLSGLNVLNIVENNNKELQSVSLCEQNAETVPIKHKCYHLNWNEKALTQDVFSKCGFITIPTRRVRSGNHMFQIAALFGIAYKLDMIPVIRPTFPLLELYNLPNVMNITLTNTHECNEGRVTYYYECNPGQTNFINITLLGFRQSQKYFTDIKGDIMKIFSKNFKRNSLSKAANFIKSVSNSSYQNVGIHVRRTDMHIKRVDKGRRIADVDYFERAMSYFKIFYEHVHFIILSDEIGWAKENLQSDDIFYSPFTSAADDLALMTLCDHMIITYSTFGWWGAWLSNGTTLFFRDKGRNGMKIAPVDKSSYFIKGSIGIP